MQKTPNDFIRINRTALHRSVVRITASPDASGACGSIPFAIARVRVNASLAGTRSMASAMFSACFLHLTSWGIPCAREHF